MNRTLTEAIPYGKPSKTEPISSADCGCRYGGPSCLRCELPQCVEDLDHAEFATFLQAWRGAQNANRGA